MLMPFLPILTDADQADGDELTIDYYDDLYCPACDKSFKSDKAWVASHTVIHPAKLWIISATFNQCRGLKLIQWHSVHILNCIPTLSDSIDINNLWSSLIQSTQLKLCFNSILIIFPSSLQHEKPWKIQKAPGNGGVAKATAAGGRGFARFESGRKWGKWAGRGGGRRWGGWGGKAKAEVWSSVAWCKIYFSFDFYWYFSVPVHRLSKKQKRKKKQKDVVHVSVISILHFQPCLF